MKVKRIILTVLISLGMGSTAYALSPQVLTFDQTGFLYYNVVGKGIRNPSGADFTSGTKSMTLPSAPTFAELYWNGFQYDFANNAEPGDPNVFLNGMAVVGTALAEQPGGEQGIGYRANVTNKILAGTNNYTASGIGFTNQANSRNNGFSIGAVYQDATKQKYGRMMIFDGLDNAWCLGTGNNGPNSEVLGINIGAANYDRIVDLTFIIGGGEDATNYPDGRGSWIWYDTFNAGATPTNLVGQAFASRWADPFPIKAADGHDWDTYDFSIVVPKGDGKLAFQIESDLQRHGESFNWLSSYVFVNNANPVPEPATMSLFGMGGAAAMFFRRKRGQKIAQS